MKKISFMLCFALMIGLATGCMQEENIIDNSNDESSTITIDASKEANRIYEDGFEIRAFEERYDSIKEKYPDKTVLIWASNDDVRYEEEVNNYLSENNSEYVICFKNITEKIQMEQIENDTIYSDETDEIDEITYFEELEKQLNESEQIDLISTDRYYVGLDGFTKPYHHFIHKGLLEPIDSYLNNTEKGKSFYNSIPEKYWETLKYNGHIYGFDGSLTCLNASTGFEYNENLCKKFGIEPENFKGSYTEIITKLFDICQKNNVKVSINNFPFINHYTDYDFITSSVYIDNDGKAKNVFETKEVKELYNLIAYGFNKGYYITDLQSISSDSLFCSSIYRTGGKYLNDGMKPNSFFQIMSAESNNNTYRQYFPCYTKKLYSSTIATGVCSSSSYKDMAFDALVKIMSDKELNNLICYGPNYEVVDGCVVTNEYYNTNNVGNDFVRYPFSGFNYSNLRERLDTAFENLEVSENIGFYFDSSKVSNQISEIENIVYQIIEEFPSENYASGDDYLKSLNKRLYDAGLQDVLDEANRQLEEYHKNLENK